MIYLGLLGLMPSHFIDIDYFYFTVSDLLIALLTEVEELWSGTKENKL